MIRNYFDKSALQDLDQALGKEYLLTSGCGTFASSTICGCNTRKYHGLLISPQPSIDDNNHVLVSGIDETLYYNDQIFQLATHHYSGVCYPAGYNFLCGFYGNPVPMWIYKMGDVVLTKEILCPENDDAIFIRYTVREAPGMVDLELVPMLAFRNVHQLSKSNLGLDRKIRKIENGIKLKPYPQYSELYLQTSGNSDFIQAPDWYFNVLYPVEKARGYECYEDLYTPGKFRVSLKKGQQIVIQAGLKEVNPKGLKERFRKLLKRKKPFNTMNDCLDHAGKQFIIRQDQRVSIKAGYPWFGNWGRDTFISLPGLTLVKGDVKTFKSVIKSAITDLKDGLFPNAGTGKTAIYNSVDASLWFIWAIQEYASYTNSFSKVWKEYGEPIQIILEAYRKGTRFNIKMTEDGLIYAGVKDTALTWMDSIIDGKAVTPRIGKTVEVNALWYNAICFSIKAANLAGGHKFVSRWQDLPEKITKAFSESFTETGKKYLADFTNGDYKDWSIRPNQIFAVSLPFSPIPSRLRKSILQTIKNELLTPRGLRTLSPGDPCYQGTYEGDQPSRDRAYHQGTVWPWLSGHFAEAYLKEYGAEGVTFIQGLYKGFEPALNEQCLYTIAELYNGNAPHAAGGAFSQAWSIAELQRIQYLISNYQSTIPAKMEANLL